jgi:hypothetical protein
MSGPPDSVSTKWNRTWKGFRLGEVPVASLQLAQSSGHGVCWIYSGVTSSSPLKVRDYTHNPQLVEMAMLRRL